MKRLTWLFCILVTSSLIFGGLVTFGNKKDTLPKKVAKDPKPSKKTKKYPVHIRTPEGPLLCDSGKKDALGNPIRVRCMTCHDLQEPDRSVKSSAALKTFHKGLVYKHGNLSCLSCHNASNYDTFRLADGTALDRRHVLKLCAQCHGTQVRDYQHGAHGGMTGYWDLTKGPRQRNHCLDCHDPHAPAYPKVRPVFRPKDRFPPVSAQEGKDSNHE